MKGMKEIMHEHEDEIMHEIWEHRINSQSHKLNLSTAKLSKK